MCLVVWKFIRSLDMCHWMRPVLINMLKHSGDFNDIIFVVLPIFWEQPLSQLKAYILQNQTATFLSQVPYKVLTEDLTTHSHEA